MEHLDKTALRWLPGKSEWASLPDLPEERQGAVSVSLLDGRTLAIGGLVEDMDDQDDEGQAVTSVLVLAAVAASGLRWRRWLSRATMQSLRWCCRPA